MLRIHTTKQQVYEIIRKMGTYHYEVVAGRPVQRVTPGWLEVMLHHSHDEDEGEQQVREAQEFAARFAQLNES